MPLSSKSKIVFVLGLIAFGILSRVLPHAWNFTPITAIVLFSAAYFGIVYSLIIFLMVMVVSDLHLGFYEWHIMLAVYGSFAIASLIGLLLKNKSMGVVFMGTISSSVLFFAITNWAVWQFSTLYSHSLSGLLQSYVMALPFFRNSLAGDVCYSGFLFGAYELYSKLKLKPNQSFQIASAKFNFSGKRLR